jgi:tripeptide aminopeptidase
MSDTFAQQLEERLVRYVQIDTQSAMASETTPSTDIQYDLLNVLVEELKALGIEDVVLTDYGVVLATLPAQGAPDAPPVAFLAHVDTTESFNGFGVKPIVHRNYGGTPIALPDDTEQVISPEVFPYLAEKTGDDIITASGTTLLGADDKAGVAIIMTMVQHLLAHPEIEHGPLRICFTPDEEIGRGVHPDLPQDLAASFAYTLDGAQLGEVVYETFSADGATVRVKGVSIHPGAAKDKLVNALHLAAKIIDTLPQATRTPETTAGREGFIHVASMRGSAAEAEIHLILRDFELDELAAHGALLEQVCATIAATEPRAQITCEIKPQYRNMRYWLENDMRPVVLAEEACCALDIESFSPPIRGGTDGSRLTELGVPTPNLFTGMQNIHGPLEWISVQDMVRATELCVALARRWASEAQD